MTLALATLGYTLGWARMLALAVLAPVTPAGLGCRSWLYSENDAGVGCISPSDAGWARMPELATLGYTIGWARMPELAVFGK